MRDLLQHGRGEVAQVLRVVDLGDRIDRAAQRLPEASMIMMSR